jgi:hypothetical protein
MISIDRKIEDAMRLFFDRYFETPHIRVISGALENNPELHIYQSIMENATQAVASDKAEISFSLYYTEEHEFKVFKAQRQYISDPKRSIKAVWLNVERVNRYVIIDLIEYCKITDTLVTDFLLVDF